MVELGAQWLFGGCPNNSAYSLAAREGLLTADSHQDYDKPPLFCTSDGRAVEPCLARAAQHTFALIESQARSLFTLKLSKPSGALLTFLHRYMGEMGTPVRGNRGPPEAGAPYVLSGAPRRRMQQEVLRYPEELRFDVAAVMHGLANALRCRTGADLASVSADHFGSAVKVAGGNARLPMGFVGVLAPLLRDLPDASVSRGGAGRGSPSPSLQFCQWAPARCRRCTTARWWRRSSGARGRAAAGVRACGRGTARSWRPTTWW